MEGESKIRDRVHLRPKEWIDLYEKIVTSLKEAPQNICKRVPLFIIRESIGYFERLEQFEKCLLIKNFADNNPRRIIKITKDEWQDTAGL